MEYGYALTALEKLNIQTLTTYRNVALILNWNMLNLIYKFSVAPAILEKQLKNLRAELDSLDTRS